MCVCVSGSRLLAAAAAGSHTCVPVDPAASHTPAAAGGERRGGEHRSGGRAVSLTHTHMCYWCVCACRDASVCLWSGWWRPAARSSPQSV